MPCLPELADRHSGVLRTTEAGGSSVAVISGSRWRRIDGSHQCVVSSYCTTARSIDGNGSGSRCSAVLAVRRSAASRSASGPHRRVLPSTQPVAFQSLAEHDFRTICLRGGLPAPTSPSVRRRRDGRYYLDAAWREYDAACEIHGTPHMRVEQWSADLFRANEIVLAGPRLLVFSSYAVRHEQEVVAEQIVALLRRGGWSG